MPQPQSQPPPIVQPSSIDAQRADAIHRALLTGLLGNVGVKNDPYEYTGPRGRKFNIFPGSALFKRRPLWVMSAELVETTKLYARTVGPVRPEWVERAAVHLVKREHWDPHWRRDKARVEAWERVTLHGLVLVARRPVDYGPIDPKLSRQIFIEHALVKGEYRTEARFFGHNQRLVEQVQTLEAKARRRDVLVGDEARFNFYDARVPQRVYNGHEFEKWRRQAEKHNPALLFMQRSDLMLHDAAGVTAELYPDELTVSGARLPLEYRYDPGHPADGVTVTVPLAALNGVPEEPFEWLVPGMLKDKAVALIRTLPKPLRVQLIPAPEFAEAALRTMRPGEGSFFDALALHLGKRAGILVPRTAFDPTALPDHLLMNFRVVDTTGKQVAVGRDLAEIRRRLGVRARQTFQAAPPSQYHRDGITRWDFGDELPPSIEVYRQGMTLLGYPALVENPGSTVSLRVLDAEPAAREAMRGGLRRLFMLQVADELRHAVRKLPNIEQLSLNYARLGTWDDLKRDLIVAIADRAFFDDDADPASVRTREQFAARAEAGWRRLTAAATDVATTVGEALALYQDLSLKLGRDFPPLLLNPARDMREQLAGLVHPGFVASAPPRWLRHLPRYLRGLQIRLQKLLNAGLPRDAQQTAQLQPLLSAYRERLQRHQARGVRDPAMEQFRWMLEELRVSLFAQELKAAVPVSTKRLEQLWEQVQP